MTELYPVRSVVIQGRTARAFERAPKEFTSVRTAEEADRALGDDGNEHFCPLCNEFFGNAAFKAHAADCIKLRAPAWERQRDKEPPYSRVKRYGKRLIVPGYAPQSTTIQGTAAEAAARTLPTGG